MLAPEMGVHWAGYWVWKHQVALSMMKTPSATKCLSTNTDDFGVSIDSQSSTGEESCFKDT